MQTVTINNRVIGYGLSPYIIAEMSGNHNQSFDQAIRIAKAAKLVGASALKMQTYTPDTLTINENSPDFVIDEVDSLWSGKTLYDLYQSAYTDWDWVKEIFKFCKSIGLDCFSSVFDETSVDFMENLNPCAYKIASFENIHYPLIRKVASTKRPLIISTGLASEEEIDEAVENARECGCKNLILLKCTSDYPADPADANLNSIAYLREKYNCVAGLSDHSMGNQVALASVAVGGSVVEKHFTVSREDKGVDSAFSSNQAEFAQLVKDANLIASALGKTTFGALSNEKKSIRFRRSIYAVKDIKKGEKLNKENIQIIRPGFGLHPRYYDKILGKSSVKEYKRGDRISLKETSNIA